MHMQQRKHDLTPESCPGGAAPPAGEAAALGRAERRVLRALARGLVGDCPKATADALGLPVGALYQQLDSGLTRRMTLEVAHALQARARRWPVYAHLARLSGHLLVPRPAAQPTVDCVLRAHTTVSREVGEAAGALLSATDPAGEAGAAITEAERAHTLARIDEAMEALAAKRALLERGVGVAG